MVCSTPTPGPPLSGVRQAGRARCVYHEDESPCVDGEPSEEAVQGDTRSQGQRNHGALNAMGRSVLASGELGKYNGLPATIIVVGLMH